MKGQPKGAGSPPITPPPTPKGLPSTPGGSPAPVPSFRVGMKSGSSGLDDDDEDLEEGAKEDKGSVNLSSLLQLFPKYDGDKKEWETSE